MALVVLGGWGLVGLPVALHMLTLHPTVPLILCGRNPAQGRARLEGVVAAYTPPETTGVRGPLSTQNVTYVAVDIHSGAEPLKRAGILLGGANDDAGKPAPRVVLLAVRDTPGDFVTLEAVAAGVPCVDVSRPPKWVAQVSRRIAELGANAKGCFVQSSTWTSGLLVMAAAAAIGAVRRDVGADGKVTHITIHVCVDEHDQNGPDTASEAAYIVDRSQGWKNGAPADVVGITKKKWVTYPSGNRYKSYEIGELMLTTFPSTPALLADNIVMRISSTSSMMFTIGGPFMRSFLWNLLPQSWLVRALIPCPAARACLLSGAYQAGCGCMVGPPHFARTRTHP